LLPLWIFESPGPPAIGERWLLAFAPHGQAGRGSLHCVGIRVLMLDLDRGAHDLPDLLMQLSEPFREVWPARRWYGSYLVHRHPAPGV